jgi:metallo-beta-lactamase class B
VVYSDSLTAVSNERFRFTGHEGRQDTAERFRASILKVGSLPCDVLLTTHPSASGMDEKVKARPDGAPNDPFNAGACKALASHAERNSTSGSQRSARNSRG